MPVKYELQTSWDLTTFLAELPQAIEYLPFYVHGNEVKVLDGDKIVVITAGARDADEDNVSTDPLERLFFYFAEHTYREAELFMSMFKRNTSETDSI